MTEAQKQQTRVEHLVAENVHQATWLRLKRLTSANICARILRDRWPSLSQEDIGIKAVGLSSSIQSADGYWEAESSALNVRILSRYYALLQISIAEQVASANISDDLVHIQKHTEQGHGLSTIQLPSGDFPSNYMVSCLSTGHFPAYCAHRGVDLSGIALVKRPRDPKSLDGPAIEKMVSLADLLRRIPELHPMIEECLNTFSLCFHIGHANINSEIQMQRLEEHTAKTGQFAFTLPKTGLDQLTFVDIIPQGEWLTAELLDSLNLPIKDIKESLDATSKTRVFVGEFVHPEDGVWWNYIKTYKSGYCATSYVLPLWNRIDDPFILHLMTLYALSIIVRYQPSLWHDVEEGSLNHIRSLLEYYVTIVDEVLPAIAIERVTGVKTVVHQPGAWSAPV